MTKTPWDVHWGSFFLAKVHRRDTDILEFLESHVWSLPTPGISHWFFSWSNVYGAIEGLALLGQRERAFELYPLAIQRAKRVSSSTTSRRI